MVLKNQNQLDNIENKLKKILENNPKNSSALNSLGIYYCEKKEYSKSIPVFKKAISYEPHKPGIFCNLGNALEKLNKFDEAIENLNKAININSNLVEAYIGLGDVYLKLRKYHIAIKNLDIGIKLNPNNLIGFLNRGFAYEKLGKFENAISDANKVIEINKNFFIAYTNKGNALKAMKRFKEAILNYEIAIKLNPKFAPAYYNKAITLEELNQWDEAINFYNKSISLNYNVEISYWNKSLLYLLKGDLEKGFLFYEWRWKREKFFSKIKNIQQPFWRGNFSIKNKTILIHAEQGRGDIIQFSRYIDLVQKKGSKVIARFPKSLINLMKGLRGEFKTISNEDKIPKTDYHCPLMSLPYNFKTTLNSIPKQTPYIKANSVKVNFWKQKTKNENFNIGICWQGSRKSKSFPLELFENISKIKKVKLFSLQKFDGLDQIKNISNKFSLINFSKNLDQDGSFTDTAALIVNMNLIITADTAISHLAGALGVKVWTVLKKKPDWRWMFDRTDTPWYPSMKLFRQKKEGQWKDPFNEIYNELTILINLK